MLAQQAMAAWAAADIDDLAVDIPDSLALGTKVLIAVFLFGVALDVRVSDFREVARRPGRLRRRPGSPSSSSSPR